MLNELKSEKKITMVGIVKQIAIQFWRLVMHKSIIAVCIYKLFCQIV